MTFENTTHLYNELVGQQYSDQTGQQPINICVFDLDSTLFNVSPRSEFILHEFARLNRRIDLLNIRVGLNDWGVYESLLRHGLTIEKEHDLHQDLKNFWKEKFFSNEYVQYDEPYSGAIHFVQRLNEKKVPLFYLTGRDQQRMKLGTIAQLKKWGLPCDPEQIQLKPHKDMDDENFKLAWMKNLIDKNPGKNIYLFENEPVNINSIGKNLPSVRIIFMNTTHSRKQVLSVPHTEIFNYNLERS